MEPHCASWCMTVIDGASWCGNVWHCVAIFGPLGCFGLVRHVPGVLKRIQTFSFILVLCCSQLPVLRCAAHGCAWWHGRSWMIMAGAWQCMAGQCRAGMGTAGACNIAALARTAVARHWQGAFSARLCPACNSHTMIYDAIRIHTQPGPGPGRAWNVYECIGT